MANGQIRTERFRPHRSETRPLPERAGIDQVDPPEPARVAQGEAVIGGLDHEMIVLVVGLGIDPPAPAHAEMKHHGPVAVGVNQAVLRAARQAGDRGAGQPLHQIRRERPAHIRPVGPRGDDPLPFKEPGKTADGGFDFGQFRHRTEAAGYFLIAKS